MHGHHETLSDPFRATLGGLGMGASVAAKTLQGDGYTNVRVLEGGDVAWRDAGLPLADAQTVRADLRAALGSHGSSP